MVENFQSLVLELAITFKTDTNIFKPLYYYYVMNICLISPHKLNKTKQYHSPGGQEGMK